MSVDYPDPSAIDEKLQLPGEEKHSLPESIKNDTKAISVELKSKNEEVEKLETNSQLVNGSDSKNNSSSSTQIQETKLESSEKEYDEDEYLDTDDSVIPKEPEVVTKKPENEESSSSKSILIGEAVVSVVTTKSVVNGTFSVPVTSSPLITEQISSPPTSPNSLLSTTETSSSSSSSSTSKSIEITTEDSSRILASVQTSRSISGARFLPFPVIDRVEQFDQSKEEATSKKVTSSESTESIIDKLDRVQSELSNGFLAGGFRNAGNTLQMDEPVDDQSSNQKRYSTIKPPGKFVPRRYSDKRFSTTSVTTPSTTTTTTTATSTTPTTTTIKSTTSKASTSRFKYQTTLDDLEGLLPKNYPKSSLRRQFPKSTATTIPVTEATTARSTTPSKSATILEEISAFLPSGNSHPYYYQYFLFPIQKYKNIFK